jgi:complex III assembly factor LYRM7
MRTARETFANDLQTRSAWQAMVKKEFVSARSETDEAKVEQNLATWEDVIKILRHNVVQGKLNEATSAFTLDIKPETELGSNESIKAGRQKQLDDLRASKGTLGCGGSSSSNTIAGKVRAFSTSAMHPAQSTKSKAHGTDATDAQQPWTREALPRPVPHFGQTVILSDGSTLRLFTTSPRGTMRLTRDPTNHPLWNPKADGRGAGDEDESGRLARFRRRFGGSESGEDVEKQAAGKSAPKQGKEAAANASAQAKKTASRRSGGFTEDDFDWMSVGGREAPAGQAQRPVKGKK